MHHWPKKVGIVLTICLITFMIFNPQNAIDAAKHGFTLWLNVILPALFPFFVVAELWMALGMVNFLGVLLEPIMRPLFRLPGSSSLVVTMGFTSGFPVGAVLTKKLYDDRLINIREAEHLLSFTNNSSPLFILGAIGVGMLHDPGTGVTLAVAHYLANFIVGLIGRWQHPKPLTSLASKKSLLKKALAALYEHQAKNSESIGSILGGAIKQGLVNIIMISGFIILFSVISSMFISWGWIHNLALLLQKVFSVLDLSVATFEALLIGIFEMSIGAEALAVITIPIQLKLVLISGVLGFGGLSVNAQVISIMANLPIRWGRFFMCRLLQIIISASLILVIYPWQQRMLPTITSSDIGEISQITSNGSWVFAIACLMISLCFLFFGAFYCASRFHD